jgi:hypothetical protein
MLDFESASYKVSTAANGVLFDIDGDGKVERVAWPTGSETAFLFLDRNGNGLPDDGTELFGDHTRLRSGLPAHNGFEALLEFDSDFDGVITRSDAVWSELRLWFDRNRDGHADSTEIVALGDRNLLGISVAPTWVGRTDPAGNMLRWKGMFEAAIPAGAGASAKRPFYDVYLLTEPAP